MVIKWRERRNGVWYPEDRLRATTPGLGYLIPLTLIASGLTTQYIPGPLGLTLNLICFFFNGIGVSWSMFDDLSLAILMRNFVDRRRPLARWLLLRRHHARAQRRSRLREPGLPRLDVRADDPGHLPPHQQHRAHSRVRYLCRRRLDRICVRGPRPILVCMLYADIAPSLIIWLIRDGDRLRSLGGFKYSDATST